MHEPIELVVTEQEKGAGGIGLSVGVSFILHSLFIAWFLVSYKPAPQAPGDVPMTRYVELIQQNSQTPQKQKPAQFTEAPGRKLTTPTLHAPPSDANRKAAMPEPTGDKPTLRPGNDGGLYQPPVNPAPRGQRPDPVAPPQVGANAPAQPQEPTVEKPPIEVDTDRLVYREPTQASVAGTGAPDWNKVVREVGKIASLGGGGDGFDLGSLDGGEKGTAEAGPLSFETAWYDWGEYAQSMVSRIRVNWYANMPQIIRTGMQGVVTIRFTIHRNGRISDVTILKTSGVPPYDFAARKAIELSSPLNALPKDFPNATERVTAMFYYNKDVPGR